MPKTAISTDSPNTPNLKTDSKSDIPPAQEPVVSTEPRTATTATPESTFTPVSSSNNNVEIVTSLMSNLSTVASPESAKTEDKKSEQQSQLQQGEELSPEEAKLRAIGLKSTHRPGFYIHVDSPRRLRIQTATKTFDLDRYCPHANADMLKWGVLRSDMTLRCGVHYWGFDLAKNGQCIAHPDETLNACPVADSELDW
ncbi:hypothetical protein BGZ51_004209 [Haplosporangium sp. Z 767]|nr:hypothetical protein BGZ50_007294 [Haplosporangium sp. Z 11]KAF9183143.1 hypothetical protein BGZ51_004209 [Haplosporangium sp. Z 767]